MVQTQSKCGVIAKQMRISKTRLCFKDFASVQSLPQYYCKSYRRYALGATCIYVHGGAQVLGAKTWEHAWGAHMLEIQVSRHAHDLCLVNTMHCVCHII